MKKILAIIVSFLSVSLHAQYTRVPDTIIKFTEGEKSLQFVELQNLSTFSRVNDVYFFQPSRFFKLSLSQKFDPKKVYKIMNTDASDYQNISVIDMRLKFYLSKRIRFVLYTKTNGYNGNGGNYSLNGYNYFAGIIIKI